MIVSKNHQALLITDGEYWTRSEGERFDLPYMKDALKKWLLKGFDVFIYIERYHESYSGSLRSKKRFYFVFTDSSVEDNLFDQLQKAGASQLESIETFVVTNSDIRIEGNLTINNDLSYSLLNKNLKYFEIENEWKDIIQYVLYAVNDSTGEVIPGGKPIFSGIKLASKELAHYTISEIGLRVTDISPAFIDSSMNNEIDDEITDLSEYFHLDYSPISSEIEIRINPSISNLFEFKNRTNLWQFDICVKNSSVKTLDKGLFSWLSLSNSNRTNESIYQSIIQTLDDLQVNPKNYNNGVVYSFLIKSAVIK